MHRNCAREGHNCPEQLRADALVEVLAEKKVELKMAASDPVAVARHLRALATEFPKVPQAVLKLTGIGRYIQTHCIKVRTGNDMGTYLR